MKVAIIEDEKPAAEKLTLLLDRLDRGIEVVNIMDSVQTAVKWLDENPKAYDLLFMDIQLLDGKSFEIFGEIKVSKPIIFTTAYQEYSLEAFKVNSIDYLLKPITLKALEESIDKYYNLKDNFNQALPSTENWDQLKDESSFKNRFMVKFGDHIRSFSVEDISYFYAEGRDVYLYANNGSKYIIDFNLEDLEGILNPRIFYRVNRSFIVKLDSIKDVLVYSNSRLKVITEPEPVKEIIVSREKVTSFKQWFDGV